MLRIADEVSFAWNPAGTALGATFHRRPGEWRALSAADLAVLEAVARLREGDREAVLADLSPLSPTTDPTTDPTTALDRLLAAGIVAETARPPERADFYQPMLYYHMFVDPLKTAAYLRALERQVRPGMRVLDVGAGAGVFAVAAARLGATVCALESGPILETARALAVENGVAGSIDFVRGSLFDRRLAARIGTFDLVLSEFIGDEIFDEEILLKTVWTGQEGCTNARRPPPNLPPATNPPPPRGEGPARPLKIPTLAPNGGRG